MRHGFQRLMWMHAVYFFVVATSAFAADPAKPASREVSIVEFDLTLVPPLNFQRNKVKEEEGRKLLPASMTAKTLTVLFEIDPAILARDKTRLPTYFTVTGTRFDTSAMSPARQLRLANFGTEGSYFDTKESDLKIAGIVAKRFQYQQKPLIGEPVKGRIQGGVKYVFCRPGLMLQVGSDCLAPSEKAFDQFQKDCDAVVATFKFTDK